MRRGTFVSWLQSVRQNSASPAKLGIFLILIFTAAGYALPPLAEDVFFEDGQSHIIADNTHSLDTVYLDKNIANESGTHVSLLENGSVNFLRSYNTSRIDLSGGRVGSFFAYDSSSVNIASGSVAFQLFSYGSTKINFTGGEIGMNYSMYDNSTAAVSGGRTKGMFTTHDASSALITGGTIDGTLQVIHDSTVTLAGGTVGGLLLTAYNGVIFLDGSGFEITDLNGVTTALSIGDRLSDYASYVDQPYSDDYLTGRITGTLADGSILDNQFNLLNLGSQAGTADIIIIPEPATMALLAVGALALARKRY